MTTNKYTVTRHFLTPNKEFQTKVQRVFDNARDADVFYTRQRSNEVNPVIMRDEKGTIIKHKAERGISYSNPNKKKA